MKKIVVFIFFSIFILQIFSQDNKLEGYRVVSFNGVTRLSFTFIQKPITNIQKEANSLKLTIQAVNCGLGNITTRFDTPDLFSRNIFISKKGKDLFIEIHTNQTFDQVKQSGSQGQRYTMHLDIFKTMSPQLLEEITSLLDFYHYVGNNDRLSELLREAQISYPGHNQIVSRQEKNFLAPRVYIPNTQPVATSKKSPNSRPNSTNSTTASAQPVLTPQNSNQNLRPNDLLHPRLPAPESINQDLIPPKMPLLDLHQDSTSMQALITTVATNSEIPNFNNNEPIVMQKLTTSIGESSSTVWELEDISFILLTRSDRFPTRIPQTKKLYLEQEIIDHQILNETLNLPVSDTLILTSTDSNQVNKTLITNSSVEEEEKSLIIPEQDNQKEEIKTEITPFTLIGEELQLTEIEQLALSYYHIASSDSSLVNYIIGTSAYIIGDYENAIRYLSRISFGNTYFQDALKYLAFSSEYIGDSTNANFYQSLLTDDSISSIRSGFMKSPIELWMTLAICGLTLLLGFGISTAIRSYRKNQKDDLPEGYFEVHKNNLERAYQEKEIFRKEPEPVNNQLPDEYIDPPILAEELNSDEEKELFQEVYDFQIHNPVLAPELETEVGIPEILEPKEINRQINLPQAIEVNEQTNEVDEEELFAPYLDEEYRRNLILKLFQNGWKNEEIAKEIHISQREIEFVIKLNS